VVAKVARDRMMRDLHERYPQYGFDRHKGYNTDEHERALVEHGPCPAHRYSFVNVRAAAVLPDPAAPIDPMDPVDAIDAMDPMDLMTDLDPADVLDLEDGVVGSAARLAGAYAGDERRMDS
jgi:hypothetical protein